MLPIGAYIKVILSGIYTNFLRTVFARDRLTSKEMRHKILTGEGMELTKVNAESCLGCAACANACPTEAITMVPFEPEIEIVPGFVKNKLPEIDAMKCIYCFYCHDFCPVLVLAGAPATIHPDEVANPEEMETFTIDPKVALKAPTKIADDRLAELAKLLASEAAPLLKGRQPK